MTDEVNTLFSGLQLIVTALAVLVAAVTVYVQQFYAKKQSNIESLTSIFEMLNETPHKSAEENLYYWYKENGTLMMDGKLNPDREGPATVVKRNCDQIGAMMSGKLIPTTEYYRIFGVLTVVSYLILKESIEIERKNYKYHMAHFSNLAIGCFDFWDKQKLDVKPEITDPKGIKIERKMLGQKIKLPKPRRLTSLRS